MASETPLTFTQNLTKKYNTELKVCVERLQEEPDIYRAHVKASLREGVGVGGTKSEAVNVACFHLLNAMKRILGENTLKSLRPIVPTDPYKDILYVLKQLFKERGLKVPTYTYSYGDDGLRVCDCTIGEFTVRASASMKRVACRKAAVQMYKQVREYYNEGLLPRYFYEDENKENQE